MSGMRGRDQNTGGDTVWRILNFKETIPIGNICSDTCSIHKDVRTCFEIPETPGLNIDCFCCSIGQVAALKLRVVVHTFMPKSRNTRQHVTVRYAGEPANN
jgi:hypothetical protein